MSAGDEDGASEALNAAVNGDFLWDDALGTPVGPDFAELMNALKDFDPDKPDAFGFGLESPAAQRSSPAVLPLAGIGAPIVPSYTSQASTAEVAPPSVSLTAAFDALAFTGSPPPLNPASAGGAGAAFSTQPSILQLPRSSSGSRPKPFRKLASVDESTEDGEGMGGGGGGGFSPGTVADPPRAVYGSVLSDVPSGGEICVRCEQGPKNSSNSLRRVTRTLADRVQAHCASLMCILSSNDLRARLLAAGHEEEAVTKWMKAIHQKPAKYAHRLPYVLQSAWIHKKCQDCLSLLLRTLPDAGKDEEGGKLKKSRSTHDGEGETTFTAGYSDTGSAFV